jgi:hypothetical protein
MTKRLPTIIALAVAALGAQACSSSNKGGTGGAGGIVSDAASGTGGVTVGTGGMTTDAAADAPHDTIVVTDTGTDTAINVAALCPGVPGDAGRTMTSPAMTAMQFCQLYLQTCTGASNPDGGPTMLSTCMATYSGLNSEASRECRSDHVCNAAVYFNTTPASILLHCGHANGNPPCADTAPDAGGDVSVDVSVDTSVDVSVDTSGQ